MRVPINLATRPFVNQRPFLVTAIVLGVMALTLTSWVATVGIRTWRDQTTVRARLRALEEQRTTLLLQQRQLVQALSTPEARRLLEHKVFLDDLIRRRSLSWIELFFDLQEHLPARARIVSLSPTPLEDGSLSLDFRVNGTSASAVIEFVRALEQGNKFRKVVLRSQDEMTSRGGGVNASVTAVYIQDLSR